ncbi:MAG TPA: hypothetical protein VIL46_17300 [Gemmataceae bacterium]
MLNDLKATLRPRGDVRKLVPKLGDADFRVREQAAAALVALGPGIAAQLEAEREASGSAEVRQQLDRVLQQLAKPELPRLVRWTVRHLAWDPTPHHRRMLGVLLESDAPNPITRLAREEWATFEKRRAEDRAREEEERKREAAREEK